MLIDEFLPSFDTAAKYATTAQAGPEAVWPVVKRLDVSEAAVSVFLFKLRGLSSGCGEGQAFDIDSFRRMGFVILGEREGEELLLGLIGKIWSPSGCLVDFTPEEFHDYDRPGYAKVAWNFSLKQAGEGSTVIETETRILCTDVSSKWDFSVYWFFVNSFSGLTRQEMLKTLRSQAEAARTEQAPEDEVQAEEAFEENNTEEGS